MDYCSGMKKLLIVAAVGVLAITGCGVGNETSERLSEQPRQVPFEPVHREPLNYEPVTPVPIATSWR